MLKKIFWNISAFNRLRKILKDTDYQDFVKLRRYARPDVLAAMPDDLRQDFTEPPA